MILNFPCAQIDRSFWGGLPRGGAWRFFIFGLHAVVFKFVAGKTDFWGACFWEYAGFVVAGLVFWVFSPASRESFQHLLRPERRKDFRWIMGLSVFSEVITLIGNP